MSARYRTAVARPSGAKKTDERQVPARRPLQQINGPAVAAPKKKERVLLSLSEVITASPVPAGYISDADRTRFVETWARAAPTLTAREDAAHLCAERLGAFYRAPLPVLANGSVNMLFAPDISFVESPSSSVYASAGVNVSTSIDAQLAERFGHSPDRGTERVTHVIARHGTGKTRALIAYSQRHYALYVRAGDADFNELYSKARVLADKHAAGLLEAKPFHTEVMALCGVFLLGRLLTFALAVEMCMAELTPEQFFRFTWLDRGAAPLMLSQSLAVQRLFAAAVSGDDSALLEQNRAQMRRWGDVNHTRLSAPSVMIIDDAEIPFGSCDRSFYFTGARPLFDKMPGYSILSPLLNAYIESIPCGVGTDNDHFHIAFAGPNIMLWEIGRSFYSPGCVRMSNKGQHRKANSLTGFQQFRAREVEAYLRQYLDLDDVSENRLQQTYSGLAGRAQWTTGFVEYFFEHHQLLSPTEKDATFTAIFDSYLANVLVPNAKKDLAQIFTTDQYTSMSGPPMRREEVQRSLLRHLQRLRWLMAEDQAVFASSFDVDLVRAGLCAIEPITRHCLFGESPYDYRSLSEPLLTTLLVEMVMELVAAHRCIPGFKSVVESLHATLQMCQRAPFQLQRYIVVGCLMVDISGTRLRVLPMLATVTELTPTARASLEIEIELPSDTQLCLETVDICLRDLDVRRVFDEADLGGRWCVVRTHADVPSWVIICRERRSGVVIVVNIGGDGVVGLKSRSDSVRDFITRLKPRLVVSYCVEMYSDSGHKCAATFRDESRDQKYPEWTLLVAAKNLLD